MAIAGYILLGLGSFSVLLNIYWTFLCIPIDRARNGDLGPSRCPSPMPLISSVVLWVSIPLLPGPGLRWTAAILSLLDPVGVPGICGYFSWLGAIQACHWVAERLGKQRSE